MMLKIFLALGNKVSGIRLKVDDLFEANAITDKVVGSLGDGYYGVDWMQQQQTLY